MRAGCCMCGALLDGVGCRHREVCVLHGHALAALCARLHASVAQCM